MESYDVAVIGAGIHGASAAYHLTDRGLRVAVFERTVPAGGPTGQSNAIVRAYYTNQFLAEIAKDGMEIFQNFAELTDGADCGFRQTGGAFLHPESDAGQCREVVAQLSETGVNAEVIEPDALAELLPGVELDDIAVGVWEPDAGYADPAGTTAGLMSKAVKDGATLRTATTVRRLELRGDHVVVTDDSGGVTRADRVLVAAGPWTRPLLQQIGVDLPLIVERHVVASYSFGSVTPLPHLVCDLPGSYYFKPDGTTHFQLGWLDPTDQVDPDDFVAEILPHESAELAAAVSRRIPRLSAAQEAIGWASLYDVSPDWQPVIGQVADRVFVDAGTSGHGFKLGPALGRQVAALVAGDTVHPGLAQFDPGRFDSGDLLASGYGAARIIG
jgi:glycine/D-amino acid oxidase-like deaminating enzyme